MAASTGSSGSTAARLLHAGRTDEARAQVATALHYGSSDDAVTQGLAAAAAAWLAGQQKQAIKSDDQMRVVALSNDRGQYGVVL